MAISDSDSDLYTAEGIAAAGHPPHLIDELVNLFEICEALVETTKKKQKLEQEIIEIKKKLAVEQQNLNKLELEKLEKEMEPSTSTNGLEKAAETD